MAATGSDGDDMAKRLHLYKYDKDVYRSAIRGEQIPHALGMPLVRLCIVRGIRYNDGYGEDLRGVLPEFTRALNARSIMSNRIPEMKTDDQIPYCIWYPESASETTLRELAHRYPAMLYHVGRACAVAGYFDLYKELDILPDVHIAEEARECGNMDIYDHIVSQPLRYDMMNDYTRTIATQSKPGAYLNGDTAVRHSLDIKQHFGVADEPEPEEIDENGDMYWDPCFRAEGYRTNMYDITEDMNIKEDMRTWVDPDPSPPTSSVVLDLLSTPLPFDLPTMDKDLLILMAAYYGDIDRYVRLRRPEPLLPEVNCCIRGIYHNTMFALWWARQEQTEALVKYSISTAISARMIMNNVLDRMDPAKNKRCHEPYLIWYPSIAAESTYRELFRLRPTMGPQILRACIAGKYADLFDEVCAKLEPDRAIVDEATAAGGSFKAAVERRVSEVGKVTPLGQFDYWKQHWYSALEPVDNHLHKWPWVRIDFDSLYYDGNECKAAWVEVVASLPEEWRDFPEEIEEFIPTKLDYEGWPPKRTEEVAE